MVFMFYVGSVVWVVLIVLLIWEVVVDLFF